MLTGFGKKNWRGGFSLEEWKVCTRIFHLYSTTVNTLNEQSLRKNKNSV